MSTSSATRNAANRSSTLWPGMVGQTNDANVRRPNSLQTQQDGRGQGIAAQLDGTVGLSNK